MNRLRRYHPIACCVGPLVAITATRFERNHDQDRRSRGWGPFAKRATPPQASADMSLYIMFVGKIVLLALAFARLV